MESTREHTEKELLLRIAEGDEQAFSTIVRQYTSIIYHQLVSLLHDHLQAEELTQNIFISLWEKRARLPEIENFPGYVYIMARNTAYKAFLRIAEKLESPPEDGIQSLLNTPQTSLEAKELRNIIDSGITALPARRREVFEMSRMGDLSYEEIATKLHISRSAVKQHIIAARVFLRLYLKEHAGIILCLLLGFRLYHFIFF